VQHWTLDLDALTAEASSAGYRQLTPRRPPFDARAAAAAIAANVASAQDDALLEWSEDRRSVRIRTTDAINPEGGQLAKQTEQSRRKRLRVELRQTMPREWEEYAAARWRRSR
jgi:hypothetical protein